ncbi:MAG TPA: hypothetical protein VIQ53_11415 [Inquilinus sp.]
MAIQRAVPLDGHAPSGLAMTGQYFRPPVSFCFRSMSSQAEGAALQHEVGGDEADGAGELDVEVGDAVAIDVAAIANISIIRRC